MLMSMRDREVNEAGSTCPCAPATRAPPSVLLHSPTALTMSQASPEVRRHANYQTIFDSALRTYRNKTGKDLSSNPLFHRLETCHSPDDIITVLRQQIPAFDQSASGRTDEDLKLTRWLDPTVKVVCFARFDTQRNSGPNLHEPKIWTLSAYAATDNESLPIWCPQLPSR